ncbi:MAG TPA: hypothetical protein VKE69_04995 [Planctomycetota bacterium]|nr:hypothetical protein [Planctomycetota bacterium]
MAQPFDHALFGLVLFSRIGDVASTRLGTPNLRLEANPVARRLGWKFALLTLLIALIPYWHTGMGVAIAVASLLVSASNFSRVWQYRALGEDRVLAILEETARASRLRQALLWHWVGVGFVLLLGTLALYLDADRIAWSPWIGLGIVTYGAAMGLHGTLFLRRLFRRVAASAR